MKKYSPSTIIFIIYLVVIVFLMLYKSVSLTPDRLLIVFLLGVIVLARSKLKSFLKDWLPFVGLLLGYEILRGFADGFGFRRPVVLWQGHREPADWNRKAVAIASLSNFDTLVRGRSPRYGAHTDKKQGSCQ